jgi:hypothetical protein
MATQTKTQSSITNHKDLMRFLFENYKESEKITSINLQKKWNMTKCDIQVRSKNVKSLYVKAEKLVKINITPIGLNNLCLQNSILAHKFNNKYHIQPGFQVCACDCGNRITYEPHYVVYTLNDDKTKTYYDFTRDFNGETWRWFKPVFALIPPDVFLDEDNMRKINKGCKCNVEWN